MKLRDEAFSLLGRAQSLPYLETHLDLVIEDITASVVDYLALIQKGCAMLGTRRGSQKVGRWRLEAAVLAVRCGSHVGHHSVGDRVGRRRSRVSSSGRSEDVTVGETVTKVEYFSHVIF